jgi:putative heme-binding domain-containing protein
MNSRLHRPIASGLSRFFLASAVLAVALAARNAAAEARLELKRGDHICLIGNTLADRMQHDGWLETVLQARFPELELTIRNLGFSADELATRPRSENFGDPDKHLAHSKADVVFAFFGYNESFAGEAGLAGFRDQLAKFIDHALAQKYNGRSAPRLVLFSPIANENLKQPGLPDGSENNARLALYTQAMAETAAAKGVPFVDLFQPTRELYATARQPLTIYGIHLTDEGNRLLAYVIEGALFGPGPARAPSQLERLRAAVLDKNLHWFNRYRTTDGYSVYGGRAKAGGSDGQTNFDVTQRELEILDVMAANRDRRIWAVARGGDLAVDDTNAPPQRIVKTNRPGSNPDGTHVFLTGEDAVKRMTAAAGLSVNLFASEEAFPELVNPVQASVDPDGRLWVAAWPSYPHWNPTEELNDKLLILPDDDGDGKADRCIVFADKLHNPTGFEFWGGGVLVAQAPDFLFLKDTDGDDKADVRVRLLHGTDSADTHHTANAFVIGPDGWLYYQRGIFHVEGVETPFGKPFRSTASGVYRWDPRTGNIGFHFAIGPNPHGDVFDRWGRQFVTDGTSGSGAYVGFPNRKTYKPLYEKKFRPVPGIGILSSRHFPPERQGNLLICNVIGFLGIGEFQFVEEGSEIRGENMQPLVTSQDPNFRPSAVRIGGDGALYVLDWQNPLIGHLQHNLRDPNRDHAHGRVYRVTADGRPLLQPVKMAGRPIAEVLEHLKSPEDGVRYRARLELTGRDRQEVIAAAGRFAESLDPARGEDAQPLVEALWVHQMHFGFNGDLLKKVARSVEPNARAAATRVLREWHDKIEGAGPLLVQLAADPDPRVRAEAVVAAAYYAGPLAPEAIFAAEQMPKDGYLSFVLDEARKSVPVDSYIAEATKAGKPLSVAAQAYMLRNSSVADLVKLEPSEAVYRAVLARQNVTATHLRYALEGLAKLENTSQLSLIVNLIAQADARQEGSSLDGPGELLMEQPADALRGVQDRLRQWAAEGKTPEARQIGYAGWIAAAGSADDAMAQAIREKESLRDFLAAVRLVKSDSIRAGLYEHIRPLLAELPPHLQDEASAGPIGTPGLRVEYFKPNPSNVALETLAKLVPKAEGIASEISLKAAVIQERDAFALRFSGTLSVDKPGKYTFFISSDDGSRIYIDGKLVVDNDGLHGMTEKEGSVTLAAGSHPLVVTYFDNGGGDGLSVAWSGPGFNKQAIPAARLHAGGIGGEGGLSALAIQTLSAVPGHEEEKFRDLAAVVRSGRQVPAAVSALRGLPRDRWPAAHVRPLVDALVAHLSSTPPQLRTSPAAGEATALTRALASSLPAPAARAVEVRLQNLDVPVVALGAVPHRMIYDKTRIVVEAGKPVEIRFSNTDLMPHNFALTLPGAMEEIGLLAEATAQAPDAMARHFIPKSAKVLVASRLLQPGESEALSFEAPKSAGVYPYVCTYPGHWRRMYGALYVVASLKEYEADPAAYLARKEMEVKDELLNFLARDYEWKIDELLESIKPLEGGRSFEVGQNAFKFATCIACHRINNEGHEIGPDLAKLEPAKRDPEHVLRSLLLPSEKIDEKFQSYVFELDSGKIVTGMILEETPDVLKIIDNPAAPTRPLVLKKSQIEQQRKSPVSLMPLGLLNRLTREEILDLVAFLVAGGDKKHALFGEHGHGHHNP